MAAGHSHRGGWHQDKFEDLLKLGWQPVATLVGETFFIASSVLGAILLLGLGLGLGL